MTTAGKVVAVIFGGAVIGTLVYLAVRKKVGVEPEKDGKVDASKTPVSRGGGAESVSEKLLSLKVDDEVFADGNNVFIYNKPNELKTNIINVNKPLKKGDSIGKYLGQAGVVGWSSVKNGMKNGYVKTSLITNVKTV